MRYEETERLTDEQFRRLTGVKREVLKKMVAVLETARTLKKTCGGRPNKLNVEDTLMMVLDIHANIEHIFTLAEVMVFRKAIRIS